MMTHKIILAGCGGMSNEWLKYAAERENADIVGLVDLYEKQAVKRAKEHGLNVPIFTDLSAAIEETGANLVFDVTIPSSHKQIVTTALQAGCNVFGEKPMAESLEDALEMIKLTEQTGKRYSVMQNRRFLKKIRALRQTLKTDVIGTVGSIHANFFLGPHFGGFRDLMDHVLILDMAIHTFDQARFLTRADPVSVYCHEYNPPGSWYKGNASAICIFEMSDGSVFSYNGSWCAEGLPTSWESEWRVTGSKGTAKWDGIHHPIVETVDESNQDGFMRSYHRMEIPDTWEGREGHSGCLDDMFDALEHDRLAETDCTDNIKSIAMVLGAVESAKTGNKIEIGI
ncbi:Gfo/Idh/MocA family oxidoreductase [Pullulanibacillus sp. KACC 23026]|uniref:Gfo/Idh/MocA family protein n=1 Tax=Pullulanibacillus sp. KACC 23026 TaxID=3028315 RepID=UPI0023B00FFA|nr:Gfo/Idh/MocA family oxidoreductase [Pullulanibacillus sp. KACC 23026]WEG14965.1 Gfo/Idh/MocA family oxidoreductase [Pullulanibacillus sp. KACC 23026]